MKQSKCESPSSSGISSASPSFSSPSISSQSSELQDYSSSQSSSNQDSKEEESPGDSLYSAASDSLQTHHISSSNELDSSYSHSKGSVTQGIAEGRVKNISEESQDVGVKSSEEINLSGTNASESLVPAIIDGTPNENDGCVEEDGDGVVTREESQGTEETARDVKMKVSSYQTVSFICQIIWFHL